LLQKPTKLKVAMYDDVLSGDATDNRTCCLQIAEAGSSSEQVNILLQVDDFPIAFCM